MRTSLALSAAILAVLQPIGVEQRVNSYTTGNQSGVSVAQIGNAFVLTWRDASQGGVWGRRLTVEGAPTGAEFRVSESGDIPAIADDPFRNFVVSWRDAESAWIARSEGELDAVRVDTLGNVITVDVARQPSGEFVVVWFDNEQQGIFGRRFSAFSQTLGPEFPVSTALTANTAKVSADSAGRFVVAWRDGSTPMIRRFSRDGEPLGDPVTVAAEEGGAARLEHAPDGSFLVAWGTLAEARARAFDRDGQPLGPARQIDVTGSPGSNPTPLSTGRGDYLVAWARTVPPGSLDVFHRRVGADGTPGGDAFRVNTYTTGVQHQPAVARTGNRVIVAWTSFGQDGSGDGVYAQVFRDGPVFGDANGDGVSNVTDVFVLINFLFAAGPAPTY